MVYKELCVFCASTLPFIFSLHGDFVFDDSEAIINNADVYSGSWQDAFSHDFWGADIQSSESHKSYRPFTVLSFRLNYFLNNERLSALQFKATNVLLHISCCFMLWMTLDCVLKDLDARRRHRWYYDRAFLTTLLFAVQPVHTEAVSGIVGRADVLAGNTFFLTILMYHKAMTCPAPDLSHGYLFLALLSGTASMLFKENGITALGVCIFYEILKFNMKTSIRKQKKVHVSLDFNSMMRLIVTIVAIFLMLFARWKVMGGEQPEFQPSENPASFSNSLITKILTYNYLYFLNLVLLVWPHWLCFDWAMGCVPLVESILDQRVVFVLLMYLYILMAVWALFSKKFRKGTRRVMLFSSIMALLPFLPASNIFFPVGFVIAERVLYISSAGFCLFVTLGFQKLVRMETGQKKKIMPHFFRLLILIFSLKTYHRAEQWRDEYHLFVSGLSVCPLNAKVHYNIGRVVAELDPQWAIEEYYTAIRLYPGYYHALNNLANLLKSENRFTEAEEYLKTALQIRRNFPAAWMNLGIVLASLNRNDEAEAAYNHALSYRKEYADCYYNLGNLYIQMNDTEKAMGNWLQTVRINATHGLAWVNLLNVLNERGDLKKAKKYIPKALEAVPNMARLHFIAGTIYAKLDNFPTAEKHYKMALKLSGNDATAMNYVNFGVLYHRWRKHPLAAKMYKKALQIDPNYAAARVNLKNLEESIGNEQQY